MNRPIIIIVIGYIIGIIWGLYLNISIVFLYILLWFIYRIIQSQYKKRKFKILSIKRYFRYIKLFFKIHILIMIIISSFISNTIVKYTNYEYSKAYQQSKEINTTGIIISNKKEGDYSDRYIVKLQNKKYYLYVDKNKNLEYGDKVKIKGEYQEPQCARNEGGFDYKEYLKTLKIYGTIYVENIEIIEKNQGNPFMLLSNKIFLKIKQNMEITFNKKTSALMIGIMLGDTTDISEKTKEEFSESNLSHVLAVSGMHISYIVYLATNSTQKALGKRKSKFIAIIVLIIYMFITGFSVSIVRAGIMGILNCLSFVVYRKSNTINNIAIATLITLMVNPYSIISLSFLLSYGGTIGIILFEPTIEKMLKNIKIKNRKWKYVFLKIQRKSENIINIIAVTISAQIIITPIMVFNFNTIGLFFLVTNFLQSLIIGMIVMGGFIQILISFISIKIGIFVAKVLQVPLYGLIFISKINLGNFKVITPNLYQIILYYVLFIIFIQWYKLFSTKSLNSTQMRIRNTIFLIKYKLKPYKKRIIVTIIITILTFHVIGKLSQELKIFFIDVGQGDSTLIITPNGKTILIDGGGSENYDVGKNTLLPYLLDRKVKELDYMMITHFDQDHVRAEYSQS